MQAAVEQVFASADRNKIWNAKFNLQIKGYDLCELKETKWISSKVFTLNEKNKHIIHIHVRISSQQYIQ